MNDFAPNRSPGELIEAMYRLRRAGRRDSQADVTRLLDHDEPMVREEAISLLLTKWKCSELVSKALVMLEHDVDDGVRAQAAIGLGAIATAQPLPGLSQRLAKLALETGVPDRVRQACGEALSTMAGRPTLMEPSDIVEARINELMADIARKEG
jgi:HEAT repeat protein